MNFEPEIWGPHYWFFLHTVAESYPLHPTSVTKKKYYDLLINFPLFIPNQDIGNKFSQLLDKYPVSPYLDSRESFVRWVHFIHNKLNIQLGKEELSMPVALEKYRNLYKPKKILLRETILTRKHIIHFIFIVLLLFIIYLLYK
jgi:hypothetical protein|tara:strand:+ start:3664 stop:4092 length:429 start_codon:yes stop_codon:yes gene_type:complete